MKSPYKILIISVLFISTLWAQKPLDKVSIQLDWLHQFQFAGYYMAKEKGFYKERGLEVSIKEFNFNVDLLKSVTQKESTYAVGKSSLILDKINGAKIVTLGAIYQHSPMILLTRKDSLIQTPKELYKKRVMLTPDARTAVAINSMIVSQGVQLEDVNFQPHSFKLDDLINGETDAMGCYLSNEPFILKQKGVAFNILDPRAYGFDFYGGLLFTSQNEVSNHPTRTHNFYVATMKGWQYAFENIEETARIIYDHYNTQDKSLEALVFEGETLKDLAEFEEGNLGKITLKKYTEILKLYSLLGYEHNRQALEEFIIQPKDILLTKEEKKYLNTHKIQFKRNFSSSLDEKIEANIKSLLENKTSINFTNNKNGNNTIQLFEKTNPLHESFRKSKPILFFDIAVATNHDNSYVGSLSQLYNKKVAISKDSPLLIDLKSEQSTINYTIVHSLESGLKLLNDKKVDAVIDLLPTMIQKLHQNNYTNIKLAGTIKEKFPLYFAIAQNNPELLSIINKTIDKISKEELQSIHNNYLSLKPQQPQSYTLLLTIAIPLLIIFIVVIITNRQLSKEIKKRLQIEDQLQLVSDTDILTSVYNRQKSIEVLKDAIAIAKRYDRELSIMFFDIDNFTKINERYGHNTADKVLVELCSLVKENIRSSDTFGRWDGEEFIIILPETNKEKAAISAKNIKELIYNYDFNDIENYISCSFGIAQFNEVDSIDSFIKNASKAMYSAEKI